MGCRGCRGGAGLGGGGYYAAAPGCAAGGGNSRGGAPGAPALRDGHAAHCPADAAPCGACAAGRESCCPSGSRAWCVPPDGDAEHTGRQRGLRAARAAALRGRRKALRQKSCRPWRRLSPPSGIEKPCQRDSRARPQRRDDRFLQRSQGVLRPYLQGGKGPDREDRHPGCLQGPHRFRLRAWRGKPRREASWRALRQMLELFR